jgi:hypothetical protein
LAGEPAAAFAGPDQTSVAAHARTTEMARHFRTAMVALPLILIAGCMAWFMFFALDKSDAETPTPLAVAVPQDPPQAPDATEAGQPPHAAAPDSAVPPDHLRILRQSFTRAGLGSKALVTFILRNDNNYSIKDPEILCAFRSRDGHYTTERRRTLNDTVDARSRKAFPGTLIGFVNIKAQQAKCSVLTASRE